MTENEIFEKLKLANKENGYLAIKIPEEISNTINYLKLKHESYENLFKTCITNNDIISNEFNIKKFLEEYSDNYIKLKEYMRINLKNILGDTNYKFVCENNFYFNYDTILNLLKLSKNQDILS